MAVQVFEDEMLLQRTETISDGTADGLTNRSKKFLREERAASTDEKLRQACDRLIDLLDRGTYTNLPAEINKIRLKLDKNQLSEAKAHHLLISLAVKFASMSSEDDTEALESEMPVEILDEPDIIISETFTA